MFLSPAVCVCVCLCPRHRALCAGRSAGTLEVICSIAPSGGKLFFFFFYVRKKNGSIFDPETGRRFQNQSIKTARHSSQTWRAAQCFHVQLLLFKKKPPKKRFEISTNTRWFIQRRPTRRHILLLAELNKADKSKTGLFSSTLLFSSCWGSGWLAPDWQHVLIVQSMETTVITHDLQGGAVERLETSATCDQQ